MHNDDLIVYPLFLFLGKQEIIANKLLLPIILSYYDTDEEVHNEEVEDEEDQNEEKRGDWRHYNISARHQVYTFGSARLIHDSFPLNVCGENKQCVHGLAYVIEVKISVTPLAPRVYAVPLRLHLFLLNYGDLTVIEKTLEVVDANDTKDEVRKD